jgi:DNA repair protein RecO (recombination protein O)
VPSPHQCEAIVLRTWPFAEADLMIAFFTREQGVVRGVARHAMRSRKRFGGALEPMTHVRATWAERPRQDVVRIDRFEIVWSPMRDPVEYPRLAALAFVAEVLEAALPDRAPEDDVFRLALATITHLRNGAVAVPVTYFALWVTRLLGWMPDLNTCAMSGESLRGAAQVYYSPLRDGVMSQRARPNGSIALSAEAIATAAKIFRNPLPAVLEEQLAPAAVQQLRRFAVTILERHLEERLYSARALATL